MIKNPIRTWLEISAGLTLVLFVAAFSCGRTGYGVSHGPTAPTSGAQREMLGMDMSAPTESEPATAGDSVQVTLSNFSFDPSTLTVAAGSTVTWSNQDSVTHTVTASDGGFDSSNLRPGQQFSHTFNAPGSFSYHCSIHPFMIGEVVVR